MSQGNDLLSKIRADRAERTAQRNAKKQRRRLITIGIAIGAVFLIAAILCLIFLRPAPARDDISARFTEKPDDIFVLRNIDDAKELYLAAEQNDQGFRAHLEELDCYPDLELSLLRKYANDIYDLLRNVPLPYYNGGMTNIYYNPNGGQMELLYDIDGIRYHFIINCQQVEHSGTPAIAYGNRFSKVYFPMYEHDGRLYADFTASSRTMALCIHTDDPEKVDFTNIRLTVIQ